MTGVPCNLAAPAEPARANDGSLSAAEIAENLAAMRRNTESLMAALKTPHDVPAGTDTAPSS